MTTKALIAATPWSADKAKAGMVDFATAGRGTLGGRAVRVIAEQLLRGGPRRQAIRVEVAGLADLSADGVQLRTDGGSPVPVEGVAGPAGSLRLLVPAVDAPTALRLAIPALDADGTVGVTLEPVREWTIHLVHHSHLDIGYTDPQGTVLAEHVAFLDSCLDLVRATADRPDEAKFRWAVESLWSFEQWVAARSPERVAEFVEYVRAGQIELTAMPYNLHTDTCSTDELHELLRLARTVRDTYGVEFTSAMQTDVPGTVAGLPDALAQIGVRYLSVAHNWAGRSVPHLNGGQHLPRLFRWRSPAGNSVLTWMTDSPHGLAYMEGSVLGFDTSYEEVDGMLPAYLTALATKPYPFPPGMFGWHGDAVHDREPYPWDVLHLRVQGMFGDNAPPRLIMADTVARWNENWLYPRLRLSRNEDFFRDAEERLAGQIQEFEGDWGDWWVEGVGSGARPLAMTRKAQAAVTGAQTMSGMSALLGGGPLADEAEHSERVYRSVSLFNEHTWGASNPWSDGDEGMHSGEQQWHWKYAHGVNAQDDAATFTDHAAAHLGEVLPQNGDAVVTYYATNTTALPRSAPVRLFVRESRVPLDRAIEVRDGRTGKPLAITVAGQQNPKHRDAGRIVTVHVPDVPPLGQVRLDVVTPEVEPEAPAPVAAEHADPHVIQNEHLRVRVDLARACVASIVELATGRELVNPDAVVGFNAYVYDTYTTAGGYNHQSNKTAVSPELELLGSRTLARPAAFIERVDTGVEQRLVYEYAADGVRWARTTLRLGRDQPRLDIENRLSKPLTMTKESAFFAFPFAAEDPTVRYEITGALTGDGLDHVPGAPQHMRAVRNWVSVADGDHAVAWVTDEAPLVHPETIALPYAPFPDSTAPREPATVYSWVHNNVWDTNFPSQQGFTASVSYAVGVRRGDERISASGLGVRTAAGLTQPVQGVLAAGPATAGPAPERSLLELDDDRVRLISVSGADGGVLLRLQSYAEEPVPVRARVGVPVTGAWTATYLGDRRAELVVDGDTVAVELPRLGTAAVQLTLG
ncbi:glycoside hydrolase family 38 N-terminal domain-containing protein [Pseudonocardia sp. DLS-67]